MCAREGESVSERVRVSEGKGKKKLYKKFRFTENRVQVPRDVEFFFFKTENIKALTAHSCRTRCKRKNFKGSEFHSVYYFFSVF